MIKRLPHASKRYFTIIRIGHILIVELFIVLAEDIDVFMVFLYFEDL